MRGTGPTSGATHGVNMDRLQLSDITDIIRRNDDICTRVVGLSGIKMGLDLCAQDL